MREYTCPFVVRVLLCKILQYLCHATCDICDVIDAMYPIRAKVCHGLVHISQAA